MIIRLFSANPEGICPEALAILRSNSQTSLFHQKHKLRHLLGIYNISLDRLAKRFNTVLACLDPVVLYTNRHAEEGDPEAALLEAQEALLYAMVEHFDDCQRY